MRRISLSVPVQLRRPLYRMGARPKAFLSSWPICFSNRMARRPDRNIRVSVYRIAHFSSLFHGVWDPQIVAELLKIIPLNPTSLVIHLPQSGCSEYGLLIHLPVKIMLSMNGTMRLIGHHSDDRMVEQHFHLLGISDVPVIRWLVYACIMRYTVRRDIGVGRPSLEVPFSPDDEEYVFRNVT